MKCTECNDKIWDYLDGTLSEMEQVEIQAHLEICNTCKAELEEVAKIRKELRGLPLAELPEGYHTELMQKLQEETKIVPLKKKKERRWKSYSLIAAAALVVVVVSGVDSIQKYQSTVLTAEEKTDTKLEEISPIKETLIKEEAKTAMPTQPKAIQNKKSQKVQQKAEQREMPKAEIQKPKAQTAPEQISKPQVAEKVAVREDTPVPMSLRAEDETHTEHNVNLFVKDTQKTLSALHKLGESLDIWEEDAGENFILFSMKKEQTSIFYAKLNELGITENTEMAEGQQDIVFIRVHLKTK